MSDELDEKPVKEPSKGQHIFANAELTKIAIQWKEMIAQNKREEAMPLLEALIRGCQEMLPRLAQYEGFHRTVDVETLVASASSKIERWLLLWDPNYKSSNGLFSWLSTCFSGSCMVSLSDGTSMRIDEIVEGKLKVNVLSFDEKTGKIVPKPVVGWHRNSAQIGEWRQLILGDLTVFGPRTAWVTAAHPMWTQRGWVKIDDLTEGDTLITQDLSPLSWTINKDISEITSSDDLRWKYDLTVQDTHTFIVQDVIVHNCAKNAFRSELAKVNQYRRYIHSTGENLEKFFGEADYSKYKDEAKQEVKAHLGEITARWGDLQEIGAVRFILDCLVEERQKAPEEPDESATATRERIIRSASFAWCVSPDLAKFFYSWALYALRDSMYKKIYIPFTEEDVLRHAESYTHLVDFMDIVGWDKFKRVIATLGGNRIKLPTLQQMGRLHENYQLSLEIRETGDDPDTVVKVGKKRGRNAKTAQEVYSEMSDLMDHKRCGEHLVYEEAET
jgi:hypothetical protein